MARRRVNDRIDLTDFGIDQGWLRPPPPQNQSLILPGTSLHPNSRFMALPVETRLQIFRYILPTGKVIRLRYERVWSAGEDGEGKSIDKSKCLNPYELFSASSNRLALILTCKQNYREARCIIYETNQWFANDIEMFRKLLPRPRLLSTRNLSFGTGMYFRDVAISLEYQHEIYGALKFICHKMPALRHLQATIFSKAFPDPRSSGGIGYTGPRIGEELLKAASHFTREHPTLRKAIWNRRNGGIRRRPTLTSSYFHRVEATFTVHFVPSGGSVAPFQQLEWTASEHGGVFDDTSAWTSTDVVVNSPRIRNLSSRFVFDMEGVSLAYWSLPITANSSEPFDKEWW